MKFPEPRLPRSRSAFNLADAAGVRRTIRSLDYRAWRENEIVRLELVMTRSVECRSRLLRVHRTVQVETLLFANERHLLRVGSALAALTRIPFTLVDVLNAAANATR